MTSHLPRPVLSNTVQAAILPYDHHSHTISVPGGINTFPTVTAPGSKGNKQQQQNKNKKVQGQDSKGQRVTNNLLVEHDAGRQSPNPSTNNPAGKEGLIRKESASLAPALTCEDEDNLAVGDINPSSFRLNLIQQLETKQDKSVHMGRLMCHNMHQALR